MKWNKHYNASRGFLLVQCPGRRTQSFKSHEDMAVRVRKVLAIPRSCVKWPLQFKTGFVWETTSSPGYSRLSKWRLEEDWQTAGHTRLQNIWEILSASNWQWALWLANLRWHDLLFARVFSKPPFWMPRRPWGRGWYEKSFVLSHV